MACIVIKDLPESVDLDHQAMVAISGGARVRGRPSGIARLSVQRHRFVSFPSGVVTAATPAAGVRGAKTTLFK